MIEDLYKERRSSTDGLDKQNKNLRTAKLQGRAQGVDAVLDADVVLGEAPDEDAALDEVQGEGVVRDEAQDVDVVRARDGDLDSGEGLRPQLELSLRCIRRL